MQSKPDGSLPFEKTVSFLSWRSVGYTNEIFVSNESIFPLENRDCRRNTAQHSTTYFNVFQMLVTTREIKYNFQQFLISSDEAKDYNFLNLNTFHAKQHGKVHTFFVFFVKRLWSETNIMVIRSSSSFGKIANTIVHWRLEQPWFATICEALSKH